MAVSSQAVQTRTVPALPMLVVRRDRLMAGRDIELNL